MTRIEGTFDAVGGALAREYFSRIAPDRMAHGYLFSGPEGAGKRTFARKLGKSLLCTTPKTTLLGYCDRCAACRQVDVRSHPDIFTTTGTLKIGERDGAGFTESEDLTARDLVRQLAMHSYAGGRRVVILEDLDFRGTEAAANALLKFFEEPPPRVLVIATTPAPERILPTIRSRLIELRFAPIGAQEMRAVLAGAAIPAGDIDRVVALAQGNLTRAFELAGSDGEDLRAAVTSWFFNVLERGSVDDGWVSRDTLLPGLGILKTLVRDWTALRAGAPVHSLLASDHSDRLSRLPAAPVSGLLKLAGAVAYGERLGRTNVAPAMVLTLVKMELCAAA